MRALAFEDIHEVKVEIAPLQENRRIASCGLSLVTASSVLPLTAGYEPSLESYNTMRNTILDVLSAGAHRPAALDPVEAAAKEGRIIDPVAALRIRVGLSLTEARERVDELRKTQDP